MKLLHKISFLILLITTLIACQSNYKLKISVPKSATFNKVIEISVSEESNKPIDSVKFFINGKQIESLEKTFVEINSGKFGIGKHAISALVYYPDGNKKINNSFTVFPEVKPEVYGYKIINEYPHDATAYTQGLEYHNGFLYETTGQRGESSLRKVDIETGKVLQKIDIDKKYFGEGMTIFNDKIYWLMWTSKKGFIYNLDTFEKEGEFNYNKSVEGWGLTHNETELIKSDGTNKIWFLNPENQSEKRHIEAYTYDRAVDQLNELELINGKLYANKYQQNTIIILDPNTGIVEGLADLRGLKKEMEKTQKLTPQDEVLNGIAYDAVNNRLFVTGKRWSKLFEIELVKK